MKPALVTGATGFLGQHLVSQLLASGRSPVRVLTRGDSTYDRDKRVEVIRGDVTSASDVEKAVKGCGLIYHLAGWVSRDPADAPKLRQIHVEGTRLILENARKFGVERVTIASSSGTIAVDRTGKIHTEESGFKDIETSRYAYYVTKIAEEKLALEFFAKTKLPIIVANPSLLLGPGDDRSSSTGGINFVDARDAATGIAAAMDRGRPGERYLLGGVNWSCSQFLKELAKLSGRHAPMMSSPTWLSLLMAPLLRKAMPWVGRKFTLDDVTIEMSGLFWYCDSTKAQRELGFQSRDPLETLRATIDDIYVRRPELKR